MLTDGSDYHHCFDRNQNGTLDRATECFHSYECVPCLAGCRSPTRGRSVQAGAPELGSGGDVPHGVYDVPHFDVHFYMEPIAKIFGLQPGPVGPSSCAATSS
jgi:hypothetical protein